MFLLLMASYVSFVQNTKSLLSMNDIEICLTFFLVFVLFLFFSFPKATLSVTQ